MTNFTCRVDEDYRSACKGLPEYRDTGFCVLHFPGEDKGYDFKQVKESMLAQKNYDFRGAIFPAGTSEFRKFKFGADAMFVGAVFCGEANFAKAKFEREASFRRATFRGEGDFSEAIFQKQAGFRKATFEKDVDFSEAIFKGEARFRRTTFEGSVEFKEPENSLEADSCEPYSFNARVNFSMASFEKRARFIGRRMFDIEQERVTFRDALIDKPENFSLDRAQLRPSWFIDTNVRNFRFTNVQWRGLRDGPLGSIEVEIKAIRSRRQSKQVEEDSQIGYPHDVLAKTCRELSANAEENRQYPLANEFHYWSMDALRKESWDHLTWIRKNWLRVNRRCGLVTTLRWAWRVISRRRLRRPKSRFGLINTLYWALSGYGVRAARAFWVLVGICAVFAALYMVFGPPKLQHLGQAVVYSLGAVARLNPEPRPTAPGLFQFLVIVEGLLGPLQIALLALAIRRKVMR